MADNKYETFTDMLRLEVDVLTEVQHTILALIEENDKEKRSDIANNSLTTLNIWINGNRNALEGGDAVT